MAKQWERVTLPASGAGPVRSGHPWVFRDVAVRAAAGLPVVLADPSGAVVGWGLASSGDIAVRVLGRTLPKERDVARIVSDRIRRADAFRTRMVPDATDAYRVVHGAGDGLPGLVIDRYGEVAIVRLYSDCWERYVPAIRDALLATGWVTSIGRKLGVRTVDGRKGLEPVAGPEIEDRLVVSECGMKLLVRPISGQKTGTFLDQREHRALVRRWSAGRRVANLFAYTGGFSVAAALGSASHVTTVDIAPEAIEDAKEIFRLNGLNPDDHAFEVADVFAWDAPGGVDLLVLDPPSLARGKRSVGAARSAYRKLHRRFGSRVARDGLLATASCTAWLGMDVWRGAVEEGLRDRGDWSWLWRSGAPPDHPVSLVHREASYLKFALLRRLG